MQKDRCPIIPICSPTVNISISFRGPLKQSQVRSSLIGSHGKAHRDLIPQILSFTTTLGYFFSLQENKMGNQRRENRVRQITKVEVNEANMSREFWILEQQVISLRGEKEVNQEQMRLRSEKKPGGSHSRLNGQDETLIRELHSDVQVPRAMLYPLDPDQPEEDGT